MTCCPASAGSLRMSNTPVVLQQMGGTGFRTYRATVHIQHLDEPGAR